MAVVVEFAGVPCSGKSTAHKSSYEYFHVRGFVAGEEFIRRYLGELPCVGRVSHHSSVGRLLKACVLTWVHLTQFISTPSMYIRLAQEIRHSDVRGKVVRSVFFKLGKGILIRRRCTQSVFVDEGILQMLFAIFIPSPGKPARLDQIGSLLKHLPLPDEVIIGPDGPEEELVHRLLFRGHHRVTGNRHTKVSLTRNVLGDSEITQRAAQIVSQSGQIQRVLIRELEGLVEVKTFQDIGVAVDRVMNPITH